MCRVNDNKDVRQQHLSDGRYVILRQIYIMLH